MRPPAIRIWSRVKLIPWSGVCQKYWGGRGSGAIGIDGAVPFKFQIPESEIDKDLPAKLRTELPGILRWMVEGAILYDREGLGDSPDIIAATEQYRQESDRLKEFFEDRCIVAVDGDANLWKKGEVLGSGNRSVPGLFIVG